MKLHLENKINPRYGQAHLCIYAGIKKNKMTLFSR